MKRNGIKSKTTSEAADHDDNGTTKTSETNPDAPKKQAKDIDKILAAVTRWIDFF